MAVILSWLDPAPPPLMPPAGVVPAAAAADAGVALELVDGAVEVLGRGGRQVDPPAAGRAVGRRAGEDLDLSECPLERA
jgi:hypothetical protein